MNQDQATRIVTSLIPQMKEEGVETTLVKYANSNELPVAQLEKLAQVFNTIRTVSTIDHADKRTEEIPVVNVSELCADYAIGGGRLSKAAGVRVETFNPQHDVNQLNLGQAFRADIYDAETFGQEKAASDLGVKAAEEAEQAVTRGELLNELYDLRIAAMNSLGKAASRLLAQSPRLEDDIFRSGKAPKVDITDAANEARHIAGDNITKVATDWLQSDASISRRFEIVIGDLPELRKRAFAIDHPAGQELATIGRMKVTLDGYDRLIARFKNGDDADIVKLAADDWDKPDVETPPTEEEEAAADAAAAAGIPDDPGEGLGHTVQDDADGGAPTSSAQANSRRDTSDNDDEKPKGGKGGKGDKVEEKDVPLAGAFGALAAGKDRISSAVTGAAGSVAGTIDKITTKDRQNKKQKELDVDIEDIKRSLHLRRMIATDPILKESDPREVLEIYNSVAQINPDIATNMPALRLVLREAVSYDGLTLDSQKQLSDVRKAQAESENKEKLNEKERYRVGGSLPLQGKA